MELTSARNTTKISFMNHVAIVTTGQRRTVKVLRIIARVIGIIVLAFSLTMLIGEGVETLKSEGLNSFSLEVLYVVVPVLFALAAFILSWWREFIGGILLVAAYLLLSFSPSVHSLSYGEKPEFYVFMFLFALPFLVCGVLFIIAARLSKRASN
jgi:hypothetical protein